MTQELPDDESQWPSDPWRILGVERGAAEREVRKAYAALIRRFRPDVFPAQFQRIRRAYDEILAELQRPDDGITKGHESWLPLIETGRQPKADPEQQRPIGNLDREGPLERRLAAAWDLAKGGRLAESLTQLEALAQEYPGSSEVASRLYWVQKLTPAISSTCRIETLLGIGNRRTRPDHWMSRYVAELRADPKEAVRDRCREAMLSASPYELTAIAVQRWRTLASFGSWWRIDDDLERIRRSPLYSPAMAATLLVISAELRLWDGRQDHHQFWENAAREMRQLTDVHSTIVGAADRWDIVALTHAERMRVQSNGDAWNEIQSVWQLLQVSATAPERELRPVLAAELVKWIRNPAGQWRTFRAMLDVIPFALHELGNVLQSMPCRQGWAAVNLDDVTAQLDEQVRPRQSTGFAAHEDVYPSLARRLYEFSVRQALPYHVVMAALRQIETTRPGGSLERLSLVDKDLPLKLLMIATWLFWDLG